MKNYLLPEVGYNRDTVKNATHTETVRLRISPKDKVVFEKAAKKEGLSFSSWARMHLMRIASEGKKTK